MKKTNHLIARIPSLGVGVELWLYHSQRHGWAWGWKGIPASKESKLKIEIDLKKAYSPTQARTIAELTFRALGLAIEIVREKAGAKQKIPGLVRVPVDEELAAICAENEIPCTSAGFVDFLRSLKK